MLKVRELAGPSLTSGATIGLLLVAAFISGSGIAESDTVPLRPGDHSWRDLLGGSFEVHELMIEQEGYLEKVREDRARSVQLEDAEKTAQPQRGA